MIELDAFKKIPPARNAEAVAHVIEILQQKLRKNDLLIPRGPGKFMILLPKTSHRAAEIIVEKALNDASDNCPRRFRNKMKKSAAYRQGYHDGLLVAHGSTPLELHQTATKRQYAPR